MALSLLKVDVVNLEPIKEFIATVAEVAGTTNDPDTATNLWAALEKLAGRIKHD